MKQITEINSKFDLKKVVVIMAAICMMVTILPMVDASDSDDLQQLSTTLRLAEFSHLTGTTRSQRL